MSNQNTTQNFNWRHLREDEVKWIGVDFDQTLAHHSGYPNYIPSGPIEGAVEAMQELEGRGYKIIIFTSRHWIDYHNIEGWLEHYGIPFRRIICGKPVLHWLIDDRNIAFKGDWQDVLKNAGYPPGGKMDEAQRSIQRTPTQ